MRGINRQKERERFSLATCPVCGKVFGIPDAGLWVYKIRLKGMQTPTYMCSWKCFRIYEKQHEEYKRQNDGRRTRWKKDR